MVNLTIFISSRVKDTKDSVSTGRCKDISLLTQLKCDGVYCIGMFE